MNRMNLEEFCLRFQAFLEEKPSVSRTIEVGQQMFGQLVSDPGWFQEFLRKLILDPDFLNQQPTSVYPNEITLHRSPDRSFSVLAYIWEPHNPSPVHDHGSWGMVGCLIHQVREQKYRRLDDGQVEGYADLEEISSQVIEPGGTSHILPLNKGIHQMGAAGDIISITIGVYGRSMRKGYTQFFDPFRKTVIRSYYPKLFKKVLGIRALGSIPEPWSEDILKAVNSSPVFDYLAREYQRSLLSKNQPDSHRGHQNANQSHE
jgi:predicted metal-dependent enzyme (double-stranded beta helix superfamily)